MKTRIAIILPYKEIYSSQLAGAASIWVKDYNKKSSLRKHTLYISINRSFADRDTNEIPALTQQRPIVRIGTLRCCSICRIH